MYSVQCTNSFFDRFSWEILTFLSRNAERMKLYASRAIILEIGNIFMLIITLPRNENGLFTTKWKTLNNKKLRHAYFYAMH